MYKPFLCLILIVAIVLSCKKEYSYTGNFYTPSDQLLVKISSIENNDSLVTLFEYNSQKKIISIKTTTFNNGTTNYDEYQISRNTAGIVTGMVHYNTFMIADSSVVKVYYDYDKSRYRAMVNYTFFGADPLYKDSSVLLYDNNGKVIAIESLLSAPLTQTRRRVEYSYNREGNIETEIYFGDDNGVFGKIQEIRFAYDNQLVPLYLSNEAFVIYRPDAAVVNNITWSELTDFSSNANAPVTYRFSYAYMPDKRPGESVIHSSGSDSKFSYYYQ